MKKHSLILAGGGLKVAFQAGVLQVWLDEAGLQFDHIDAASGGVFNLAMLCQGMSGRAVADNWRTLDPKAGIDLNLKEIAKLLYGESLFTLDDYRRHVFTGWGLDWVKIRASSLNATFNVVNFSRRAVEVIEPQDMTEDMLVACVSLPMWFPPARINGQTYIDAVFLTDANLEEAIRRGADEIWVIWTVSDKDEWHSGFVANYFQIIETCAVGRYQEVLRRIAANNEALANGQNGEFGRHIEVRELKADYSLHYLIDFNQDRLAEAVNAGVQYARQWCAEQGIDYTPQTGEYEVGAPEVRCKLTFSEDLKGYLTPGTGDFEQGYAAGKDAGAYTTFHLDVTIADVHTFVTDPDHESLRIGGYVRCDALGVTQNPITGGAFNLIVDTADPAVKHLYYRLHCHDAGGAPVTLSGFKIMRDDPGFDSWSDTTKLYTRLVRGHLTETQDAALRNHPEQYREQILATGLLYVQLRDFLRQLTTFRVTITQGNGDFLDKVNAMTRFGEMFLGKLWNVYAREVLTSSPF